MLDLVPIWLLKFCADAKVTMLTRISVQFSRFPQLLKNTHVKPPLKKPYSDPEYFSVTRPVSNQIIEKVVPACRILRLESCDLQEEYRSAYEVNHRAETVWLLVQDYTLRAMDSQWVVVLVMSDLSLFLLLTMNCYSSDHLEISAFLAACITVLLGTSLRLLSHHIP